jgi:hypothetical protein
MFLICSKEHENNAATKDADEPDEMRHHPSFRDVVADVLGAGALLVLLVAVLAAPYLV